MSISTTSRLTATSRSTFATDPNSTGYPTRIIAGENRQGTWSSGAVIDNFQITGQLIDRFSPPASLPYGGDGALPTFSYGSPTVTAPATPAPPGSDLRPARRDDHRRHGRGPDQVRQLHQRERLQRDGDRQGLGRGEPARAGPARRDQPELRLGAAAGHRAGRLDVGPAAAYQVDRPRGGGHQRPGSATADSAGILAAGVRGVFIGPIPQ